MEKFIDLRGLTFKEFIELHQALEDKGEKMYTSTKNRKSHHDFLLQYDALAFVGYYWEGGGDIYNKNQKNIKKSKYRIS